MSLCHDYQPLCVAYYSGMDELITVDIMFPHYMLLFLVNFFNSDTMLLTLENPQLVFVLPLSHKYIVYNILYCMDKLALRRHQDYRYQEFGNVWSKVIKVLWHNSLLGRHNIGFLLLISNRKETFVGKPLIEYKVNISVFFKQTLYI